MTLTEPITKLRSALRTWTWGGFKAEWMYYRNNQNLLLLESILLFLKFTKSSKHPLSPGWDIYVDFIVNWKRTFPQCRAWVMTKKKKKLYFYSYSHIVRLWTQKHYFKRLITFLKNKNKKDLTIFNGFKADRLTLKKALALNQLKNAPLF